MRLHTFDVGLGAVFSKSKLGNLCFCWLCFLDTVFDRFWAAEDGFLTVEQGQGEKVQQTRLKLGRFLEAFSCSCDVFEPAYFGTTGT